VAKLKSDVALINTDLTTLKQDVEMNKNKNTPEIAKLKSILVTNEVVDTDNIISGIAQANTQLVCGPPILNFHTFPHVILDDFTVTKSKSDLFRFMRRGADYNAIHVLRSAKRRISLVILLDIQYDPARVGDEYGGAGGIGLGRGRNYSDILLQRAVFFGNHPEREILEVTLERDIDVNARDALVMHLTYSTECTGTINKGSTFTMYEI